MINFDSFSFSFGKRALLHDVRIDAPDGNITVILGNNGCGKTTLLNSVFSTRGGTSEGKVTVDGNDTSKFSARGLARLVALMPQRLPTPHITVRELVSLGRSPYVGAFGRLTDTDRTAVDSALSDMGIVHLSDMPVSRLSGGERQASFFAMLLAKDSKNVLLDEPVSALDVPNRARLFSFVCSLKERGKCVILVMHDLTDAVRLADRIYVIDGGAASCPMSPSEFSSSEYPARVFASRAHTINADGESITVFLPL